MIYLKPLSRRLIIVIAILSSLCTAAQVLVHEEPLHVPIFQNNQIRILNVILPPGDTTQYHIHHTPSIFIYFTATTVVSQLQGGSPITSTSTAGNIFFENLAAPNLRIHRVWNIDIDTLHVMDIELLTKNEEQFQKQLNLQGLEIIVDTTWARVYRLTLSEKNKFKIKNKNRSLVMISLNTALVKIRYRGNADKQTIAPANYYEIKHGDTFSLKNKGIAKVQFALLEMRQ